GNGDARDVALHVGEEDGDAGGRELLRHELERLRLAGAGGAGDQAVSIEERQRRAHDRLRRARAVVHGGAERDRRATRAERLLRRRYDLVVHVARLLAAGGGVNMSGKRSAAWRIRRTTRSACSTASGTPTIRIATSHGCVRMRRSSGTRMARCGA